MSETDPPSRFDQLIRTALGLPLGTPEAMVIAHAALLRRIAETRTDVLDRAGIVADPASPEHRCPVPQFSPAGARWPCPICHRDWTVIDGVWRTGPR